MKSYLRPGLICLAITGIGVARWLGRGNRMASDMPAFLWASFAIIPIVATIVVGTFAARSKLPWNWTKTILASFLGWVLTCVVMAGVAGVYLWHLNRSAQPDLDQLLTLHAGDAVERAQTEFGVPLDYTPESLTNLDRLLEGLHQCYATNGFDQPTLGRESRLWGAYIGGVFKKSAPAEWKRDSAAAGPSSLPLTFSNGSELFPCTWALKRIVNGEEDNVMVKYSVAIKSLAGGASVTNEPGLSVGKP